MKIRKLIAFILALCLILISSVGCATNIKNEDIKIMFIPKSSNSSFWDITIDGFRTALVEYNISGNVFAPIKEEDYETQLELIQKAIDDGYDAIILSSIDYTAPVELLKKAQKEGISIIIVDSDVEMESISVRISTDNYEAGRKMGEQIAQNLNYQGNVGLLNISGNTKNLLDRVQGCVDVIESYENMKIVANVKTKSNAVDAMTDAIQMMGDHQDLDAVASFNELTTIGLGAALEITEKDIYAIGFDNNVVVVEYLEKGIFDALMVQNQFAMGYLAVQYGYQLIKGELNTNVDFDTGINVVTRDNMYDIDIQTILFPFEKT